MNILIVYTYPNHESLNASFLQHTLKGLHDYSQKHEVQVLDLYAENFNPVLDFHKEKRRRDLYKDPDLEKYREQIKWANQLIFIYPIWWGRPPAMLLGYIDKLFSANFAYRNTKGLFAEGLLKGKSAICISTMKGPTHYPFIWLHNAHKILMKRALFQFVGIKKIKFFEFGSMEKKEGKQQKRLLQIESHMRNL